MAETGVPLNAPSALDTVARRTASPAGALVSTTSALISTPAAPSGMMISRKCACPAVIAKSRGSAVVPSGSLPKPRRWADSSLIAVRKGWVAERTRAACRKRTFTLRQRTTGLSTEAGLTLVTVKYAREDFSLAPRRLKRSLKVGVARSESSLRTKLRSSPSPPAASAPAPKSMRGQSTI